MGTNAKDAELDIVAKDKTARATKSAARNFDQLKRKIDNVNKSTDRMSAKQQVLVRRVEASTVALGKMTGAVAAVVANIPNVIALVTVVTKLGVSFLGSGAALAVFGGVAFTAFKRIQEGAELTKGKLNPALKESVTAYKNMTKAWEKFVDKNQPRVLALFADGFRILTKIIPQLQPLFNAGAAAVERFIRWVERKIDDGSLRRLIDYLSTTAGPGFERFSRGIDRARDALTKAVTWWRNNQDAITAVKTALASLAIAVGIATGGWLIALGGVIALVITYWDKLTVAVQRARAWFQRLYEQSPAVQDAVARIRDGVRRLWDGVQGFLRNAAPGFNKFFQQVGPLIQAVMPYIGRFTQAAGRILQVWLPVLGRVAGAMASAAARIVGSITSILNAFRTFAGAVASAIQTVINWINRIPSVKTISLRVIAPGAGFLSNLVGGLFADGNSWSPTSSGLISRTQSPRPTLVTVGSPNVTTNVSFDVDALLRGIRTIVRTEVEDANYKIKNGRR